MIPLPFDYTAPRTLQQALLLLESGDPKILAGGMSLIPMMKLRLAAPEHLVDLGRVPDLNTITEAGGALHIGAMATHHDLEISPLVRGRCPLLAEVAARIGDPQVRNRGTLGGSIAHADPAADHPAALLALEARLRLVSATSDRTVDAADFFVDAFTTALQPGEIILELEIPVEDSSEGWAYEKVPHPASGFAVVGVAVRVKKSAGSISMARIGVTGLGPHAFRDRAVETMLEQGAPQSTALAALGQNEDANADMYASAEYRRHLTRIHAGRALKLAASRAL